MIVFGSSMSPFVRKVVAFAAEKGVAIDHRQIGLGSEDPEFLAASPFRKIPAMIDGDYHLADSSAIVHYIEAVHPDPALIPADPKLRGRAIWFDEFADTLIFACFGKMFFNRVVAPRFMGLPCDAVAADTAQATEMPPLLDYLEGVIPDSGFLVGDRLTLADIAVSSPFVNLEHAGVTIDAARHPRLAAYVAAILARPSFAGMVAKERRFLAA